MSAFLSRGNSLCRPLWLAGVFLCVVLAPAQAYAANLHWAVLDPQHFWIIPATFAVEYPLVHFLCGGQIIRAVILTCVMNVASTAFEMAAQITFFPYLMEKVYVAGVSEELISAGLAWVVIVVIESFILIKRQTRGDSVFTILFLTGLVNAATMWLVLQYAG